MSNPEITTSKPARLTVKDLLASATELVKNGYGDKYVLLTGDDECNSLHICFYTFTEDSQQFEDAGIMCSLYPGTTMRDYVVLG